MNPFDLMATNKSILEFKPMTWRAKIAYQRASARRLRYVCAPDVTLWGILETMFWLTAAGAAAAFVIGFPLLVIRWFLCM